MSTFLTMIGEVIADILEYIPQISAAIIQSPILAVGLGFFFIGGVVGIFGRLISRG